MYQRTYTQMVYLHVHMHVFTAVSLVSRFCFLLICFVKQIQMSSFTPLSLSLSCGVFSVNCPALIFTHVFCVCTACWAT